MLGISRTHLERNIRHAVNETFCDTAEGGIIARWGTLPPHGTHDPNVMVPAATPSWFLDIDAFAAPGEPNADMDVEAICQSAQALAKRSYAFFRWAVTERFLQVYGKQS